jgi:hypothetical protein
LSPRVNGLLRVVWAPVLVLLSHSILASLIGHRRDFDPLFHFLGGAAGAHAIRRAVAVFPQRAPLVAIGHVSQFAVAAVAVVAVLWEVAEFAADLLFGFRIQLGWSDTGIDLVLGIGGAIAGAHIGGAFTGRGNRPD